MTEMPATTAVVTSPAETVTLFLYAKKHFRVIVECIVNVFVDVVTSLKEEKNALLKQL